MSEAKIPKENLYTKDHEWVRIEGGTATVGITDYAQGQLMDIVYIEVKPVGTAVKRGESAGTVEAVKAAAEVFSPLSGEIVEVNERAVAKPETLNQSPYEDGWILRLKPSDLSERETLLDAGKYAELTADE